MSNPGNPENEPTLEAATRSTESNEANESFKDILSQFELTHSHRSGEGGRQLSGTVVAVSPEFVFVDIGYKVEGVLPAWLFFVGKGRLEPGTGLRVSVKERKGGGNSDF